MVIVHLMGIFSIDSVRHKQNSVWLGYRMSHSKLWRVSPGKIIQRKYSQISKGLNNKYLRSCRPRSKVCVLATLHSCYSLKVVLCKKWPTWFLTKLYLWKLKYQFHETFTFKNMIFILFYFHNHLNIWLLVLALGYTKTPLIMVCKFIYSLIVSNCEHRDQLEWSFNMKVLFFFFRSYS